MWAGGGWGGAVWPRIHGAAAAQVLRLKKAGLLQQNHRVVTVLARATTDCLATCIFTMFH